MLLPCFRSIIPNIEKPIEPSTQFKRYPAPLTAALTRIAVALARIKDADIVPAAENQLRASAKVGTIHYSTLIEGNELPMIEAERATKGELAADTKAKIELVNYVEALAFLDRRAAEGDLELTPELIKKLHGITTKDLGSPDSEHFKPRHEGEWRDGRAFVADRVSGVVFHEGPPTTEVPPRMDGLCRWVRRAEEQPTEYPPAVIAGVVHYHITDIHPFADGNGRVARLLSTALLMRHNQVPGHIFSFERYYADDRDAYYAALRSVRRKTLNMEEWLTYFLEGLAEEYERVAAKVTELAKLGLRSSTPLQLTSAQERGLTALSLAGMDEFSRADYQRLAETSRSGAIADLRRLVDARLILRRGQGPAARYRFRAGGWKETRGRRRKWTDERIEQELREFCGDRTKWPTVAEFKGAGRLPLYQAIVRFGGAEHWAERLGLSR